MNVAIITLGCKVNTYESDRMAEEFQKNGFSLVSPDEPAQVYVVNTCTVTQMADKKSRQVLHRLRRINPGALIVAAGCYVRAGAQEDIQSSADLLIPNEQKASLVRLVMEKLSADNGALLQPVPVQEPDRILRNDRTRAFLKIQDGCRQYCSYCIIPYVRGPLHSVDPQQVLKEAREMAAAGYREIVLTGIHLSSYGRKGTFSDPQKESSLSALICALDAIGGLERIRLGSLEPRLITEDFLEEIRGCRSFCPQFHLSLQSGCEKTLHSMNRHYTPAEYAHSVELIRNIWPLAGITTDVIVGFPGENSEDFAQSAAFLEKVAFSRIHVFKYSRREGTAAAARPGQVPEDVKNERSETVLALSGKLSEAFARSMLGQSYPVLLEEKTEQGWTGYTPNYMRVFLSEDSPLLSSGEIVPVFMQEVLCEQQEICMKGELHNGTV